MGVKDDLAVAALTRALVRTGMYVDAGIDTSAGLDKPQVYAAAILNDPDLAADGLHFVLVETLDRLAASPAPSEGLDAIRAALTDEDEIAHGEAWNENHGHGFGLGYCAYDSEPWPCRTQRGIDRLLVALSPQAPTPGDAPTYPLALNTDGGDPV